VYRLRMEVRGVSFAHGFRECDEGSAVVYGGDATQRFAGEFKNIAREDVDSGCGEVLQGASFHDGGLRGEFFKQLANCVFGEFGARDVKSFVQQPVDVAGFPAQGYEYPAALGNRQGTEVVRQQRIGFALVEGNIVRGPPFMPEIVFHSFFLFRCARGRLLVSYNLKFT